MNRTIFYQQCKLTGRFRVRYDDEDGVSRREWVAADAWDEFLKRWSAQAYNFVETDFDDPDPQDRR